MVWMKTATGSSTGRLLPLARRTKMKGEPAVGSRVELKAVSLEDGSLLATKVEGVDLDEPQTKSEANIRGILEETLEDGSLVVDGRTITVSVLTEFENDPVVGDFVKIEAFFDEDGVLIARQVEGKGALEVDDEIPEDREVEIEGTIDQINDDGSIVVNGISVVFGALSDVKGDLTVGSSVEIKGVLLPDGTLLAGEARGEGRRATSSGTEVKLRGPIEQIDLDENGNLVSIVVEGLTIVVEPLTRVEGTLEDQVTVEIKAVIIDGVFIGSKIDVQGRGEEDEDEDGDEDRNGSEVKIEGQVTEVDVATSTQAIAGITVNGANIQIDASTRVEGVLAVGALVEIKGVVRNGLIIATKIEIEEPEEEEPEGSEFELEGKLDSIDRGVDNVIAGLVLDGVAISVEPLTRFRGHLEQEVYVKVKGVVIGDVLVATKVKVRKAEEGEQDEKTRGGIRFEGVVASATSTSLVLEDGTSFILDESTVIDGTLSVDAKVKVEAKPTDAGLLATEVVVKEKGEGQDRDEDRQRGKDKGTRGDKDGGNGADKKANSQGIKANGEGTGEDKGSDSDKAEKDNRPDRDDEDDDQDEPLSRSADGDEDGEQ